jgi:hypothetical protein
VTFSLRGDEKANEVTFFMQQDSSQTRGISFENQESYAKTYIVNQYENVDVTVELEAINSGIHDVYYGYRIDSETDEFGFNTVVQDFFQVVVDDDGNQDSDSHDVDVLVPGSSGSSGSGSGGSGGSGGTGGLPADTTTPQAETPIAETISANDPTLQDISTQGSSTTQGVVDTEGQGVSPTQSGLPFGLGGEPKTDGKMFLVAVMVLGFFAIVFQVAAINHMKKNEDVV